MIVRGVAALPRSVHRCFEAYRRVPEMDEIGHARVTAAALVRLLSKPDYGALAFALSVVAIGGTAAALGLDKSAGRFVPIYEEQGRPDRVMSSIATMTAAMVVT